MSLVTVERRDSIAVVTLDNPPVNALTQALRASLLETMRALADDDAIVGAVLRSAGRTFVAGADIEELDHGVGPPHTPEVVASLERLRKPVVAALHGAALGGGLEVALACHARVATAGASVGFPEVRLGLLPGASGTQLLPRIVGAETALEIMLSGEPVDAGRALELGILDAVVADGALLDAAIERCRELATIVPLPRVRDRPAPVAAPVDLDRFRDRFRLRLYGGFAAPRILESVANASRLSFDDAIAAERRLFLECLGSGESGALRHAFLAERAAVRDPDRKRFGALRPAQRAAVVGAGTMGLGIAYSLLEAGLGVVLHDIDAATLAASRDKLGAIAAAAVRKGRLTPPGRDALLDRLEIASDMTALASADVVIEAVYENLSLKREVFAKLDAICDDEALLATNTSTLDIDVIAASTRRAAAVLGLHFFSPAHVMRLIEIVRGAATSDEAIGRARSLARRLGKIGVVVGNAFGFVGNRMYHSYSREAQRLLLEGAPAETIDGALTEWGMAMGPLAVADLAGLDVGYRIRRERTRTADDATPFRVADALVEAGRLGQKTGRGFYRYEPGSRSPLPDPAVAEMAAREGEVLGIERRVIAPDEIVERCLAAMIVEGVRALEAGIARSAADIDVIWLNGYGFPRFRGGPMFHADHLGPEKIYETLRGYSARFGTPDWQPPSLLEALVQRGDSFASLGSC